MSGKTGKVNIPDAGYIREMFSECSDPIKAINQFQTENGLQIASLEPVLPLLDLHGLTRVHFHHSVIKVLRGKVSKALPSLPRDTLEKLLKQAFSQMQHKELAPVGLEIMRLLDPVPAHYLKKIAAMPDVYKQCPIEVKRQVWEKQQGLFGDEVRPILNKYIWEKDVELHKGGAEDTTQANISPFFAIQARRRRDSPVIQKLRDMIGSSTPLYHMMLKFVRTLYLKNKTPHFCTLRADLLMSFHDSRQQGIYKEDPCHDFAFYIHYAVNERRIEEKIEPKLKEFYLKAISEQTEHLGDVALILADPYVINVVSDEIFRCLNDMIEKEMLPRDNSRLHFLLKFLNLGMHAWSIIHDDSTDEPDLNRRILKNDVPLLMLCLTEDLLHSEIGSKYREGSVADFVNVAGKSPVTRCLLLHYVLQLAVAKNIERLKMIIPLLHDSISTLDEVFVHCLVSQLLLLLTEWKQVDFCNALFDNFLSKYCQDEVMLRHVLRLLWTVHQHMDSSMISSILANISPKPEHSQQVRDLFNQLSERSHLSNPGSNGPGSSGSGG